MRLSPIAVVLLSACSQSGLSEADQSEFDGATEEEALFGWGCPDGMVCRSGSFSYTGDTSEGENRFSSYSCSGSNQSGPEQWFEIELDEPGYLVATVEDGAGVDVDVHILTAEDRNACLDRGDTQASGFLEAGTYYVVVDTYGGWSRAGEFALQVGWTGISRGGWYMSDEGLEVALRAFDTAYERGDTDAFIYSVVDFSVLSGFDRLHILDLETGETLFTETVAHGIGSSNAMNHSTEFSNTHGSEMSSLGLMRTLWSYEGQFGYSLRIEGLEHGINHNVQSRAIVIHPWVWGSMVPTQGCFGLSPFTSEAIIDTVKDGTLWFAWAPDEHYAENSAFMD